ncbi:hypothetical protein ACFQY0_04810 [Haloferula chungangensis]|uniref:Uncharacterized protein n=1 Tax=Haloferula chungangensis TaxID=1048331 RepID=A0ABW2L4H8_9BACT
MKGKGALWLWVGVLAVFLAGGAFVGYKLWKRQKNRAEAQRWEVTRVFTLTRELNGSQLEEYLANENEKLDRYEVLRPVIDDLDLVAFWGVADADAALVMLKDSAEFRVGNEPNTILFAVSDKDKEMAGRLGQAIGRSYEALLLRDRLRLPPPPPAGFGE